MYGDLNLQQIQHIDEKDGLKVQIGWEDPKKGQWKDYYSRWFLWFGGKIEKAEKVLWVETKWVRKELSQVGTVTH